MTDAWQRDDSSIPSGESLLRRIPDRPEYFIHFDSITERPYATGKALQIDRDSGLSIHFERTLMSEHQVDRDAYYPSDYLIQFTPEVVRTMDDDPWGVVREPDPDDAFYGKAHGEVRNAAPRPSKSQREAVREAINRGCTWIRSPEP